VTNIEKEMMKRWKIQSSEEPGFHAVITPQNSDCKVVQIYRLNLPAGTSYTLETGPLEMHPVLISGEAKLCDHKLLHEDMIKFDSFYLPAEEKITIYAVSDCIFYIPAAKYEGIGTVLFRKFDPTLPIGDIHQIHGSGVGQREVMFTLAPQDSASRLICGLTWGGQGAWTSWPPHQHEKDLEEVYCYFDMPHPRFGFHISYLKSGEVEDIVTHTVTSGTMVQAPKGYHPTVASPSVRNTYLWALASFTPEQRSYDLAVLDPVFGEE
jgi:5-deoxy-glucuronate isomerase